MLDFLLGKEVGYKKAIEIVNEHIKRGGENSTLEMVIRELTIEMNFNKDDIERKIDEMVQEHENK